MASLGRFLTTSYATKAWVPIWEMSMANIKVSLALKLMRWRACERMR